MSYLEYSDRTIVPLSGGGYIVNGKYMSEDEAIKKGYAIHTEKEEELDEQEKVQIEADRLNEKRRID